MLSHNPFVLPGTLVVFVPASGGQSVFLYPAPDRRQPRFLLRPPSALSPGSEHNVHPTTPSRKSLANYHAKGVTTYRTNTSKSYCSTHPLSFLCTWLPTSSRRQDGDTSPNPAIDSNCETGYGDVVAAEEDLGRPSPCFVTFASRVSPWRMGPRPSPAAPGITRSAFRRAPLLRRDIPTGKAWCSPLQVARISSQTSLAKHAKSGASCNGSSKLPRKIMSF